MINISELNTVHGIPNTVEFISGPGGLPTASITNKRASALHTYFSISRINDVSVSRLDGCACLDTLNGKKKVQSDHPDRERRQRLNHRLEPGGRQSRTYDRLRR